MAEEILPAELRTSPQWPQGAAGVLLLPWAERERSSIHARLWSLIASGERHGLDPQHYLTSVLAKIGQTPASDVEQFLPDVWKRKDAAEPRLAETNVN